MLGLPKGILDLTNPVKPQFNTRLAFRVQPFEMGQPVDKSIHDNSL